MSNYSKEIDIKELQNELSNHQVLISYLFTRLHLHIAVITSKNIIFERIDKNNEEKEELEKKQAKLLKEYESKEVPRPKRWGGYIVKYETVEIWQGRPNRLHDRFEYQIDENKNWSVTRLSP